MIAQQGGENCIFCKIAEGKIPARIVYRDAEVIAFHDVKPKAPIHILLIPRKHISSIEELAPEDICLIGKVYLTAKKIIQELNLESGYRIVINSGRDAGQSVLHLHFHLLAGRQFSWPPG